LLQGTLIQTIKSTSKLLSNKGQASIEFIVTLSVGLLLLVTVLGLALNFTVGYLAHYANFVASRTYLTYDHGSNNPLTVFQVAATEARNYFEQFQLANFGIGEGQLGINAPHETNLYEYVGTYYMYSPPISFGIFGNGNEGKLLTESFLGKEPSRSDCRCQVQNSVGISCDGTSFSNSITQDVTLFDNGC
jgi:hypothetical protein